MKVPLFFETYPIKPGPENKAGKLGRKRAFYNQGVPPSEWLLITFMLESGMPISNPQRGWRENHARLPLPSPKAENLVFPFFGRKNSWRFV